MQSTKEEYHFTRDSFPPSESSQQEQEALLLQHQKRMLLQDSNKLSMRNIHTGSEKLLVVLLVASATVCFLTNLLVYLILTLSTRSAYNRGRRVKLVLRYQLMRSQALAGLLTASIVIYPLRILATSFEQHQHPSGTIAISPDTTVTIAASGNSNAWSLRTLSESRCRSKTTMTQFLS